MNLNTKLVLGVLLVDGWHAVDPGSFQVETLRLIDMGDLSLISNSLWFEYREWGSRHVTRGPFTSVLAVRMSRSPRPSGSPRPVPRQLPPLPDTDDVVMLRWDDN